MRPALRLSPQSIRVLKPIERPICKVGSGALGVGDIGVDRVR
jgi:hypothetical protein